MSKESGICAWQADEDGNLYTDCGEIFCIEEGTPVENGFKFCIYCGKPMAYCSYRDPLDDEEEEAAP